MKPDFLTLALENVFNQKQDSLVKEQFKSLLDLIKKTPHRELLVGIDSWCQEHVQESQKKLASQVLKNNFFGLWTHKNYSITQEDLPYLNKYYPFLSLKEQQSIKSLVQEKIPSIALDTTQTKTPSEVSVALKEYRNGNIMLLQNFVASQNSLSSTDYDRILKELHKDDESFLIKVECYEKVRGRSLYYLQDSDLQARTTDFQRLWNHLTEQTRDFGNARDHANYLYSSFSNDFELMGLSVTEKNFHMLMVYSVIRIAMAQEYDRGDNAVHNTNFLFSKLPFLKNFVKKHEINVDLESNAFINLLQISQTMDERFLPKNFSDLRFIDEEEAEKYYDDGMSFLNYFMLNNNLSNNSTARMVRKI